MNDPETANNIMLTFISMPYMLVLDPLTHLFYVPEENIEQMNASSVGKFLKTVKADKVQVSENACKHYSNALDFVTRRLIG